MSKLTIIGRLAVVGSVVAGPIIWRTYFTNIPELILLTFWYPLLLLGLGIIDLFLKLFIWVLTGYSTDRFILLWVFNKIQKYLLTNFWEKTK